MNFGYAADATALAGILSRNQLMLLMVLQPAIPLTVNISGSKMAILITGCLYWP